MVQMLPSLQHLFLSGFKSFEDGFPVSITSSCSQLRCLQILYAALEAVPSELGRLTALTRLDLRHTRIRSLQHTIRSLPDSVSCLTRLPELDVEGTCLALSPGLSACRQLTRLAMDSVAASPVLTSLPSLRCLNINGYDERHKTYWTQLTALTELQLDYISATYTRGCGA